ncbi:CDP-diacylglycerol--glycerol-3-phosphate 3-phosphatidyltransferase [Clostridium sp. OS1-26]|uniref:CDP-diacylglycerol--glycerol-3-phosphate 3-phosphatidyltransferase n=1 Tax=Clostridium sp. OS1-26 TaxID=3070681 RepID=UPI0027E056E4|nr:CDP-diacylglycerol--glycerol-3-phosphate 3-phosphatidyltransferase [Clostridium sp. OS1-26]WML36411.1 CDP-diacylglycerol--glycerol-3-phosphate 3-phosphatidyltransferase [Clostridium sp. OS1-26]
MNLPNILTLFRLLLIPVFILLFFSNVPNNLFYSIFVFLAAGLTDILDGYLARKYSLITKLGIVLDPLADKLMILTVLSCLVIKNYVSLWILIIISIKEVSMIFFGIILYNKNTVIPSNKFGKLTTILFYLSIFTLTINIKLGTYLIYLSVISALIAFVNYFILYYKNKQLLGHNDKNVQK